MADHVRAATIAATALLGAAAGWILCAMTVAKDRRRCKAPNAPSWIKTLVEPGFRRVRMREWEDHKWREALGWRGQDLCHSPLSDAVFISAYFYNPIRRILLGAVHFGPNAESHRGLCHGGACTSAFDDAIGHLAFLSGRGPWAGATVQVNVSLKRPIQVGDCLVLEAKIDRVERGKKVFILAELRNASGEIFASCEGLSIAGARLADNPSKRASTADAEALRARQWRRRSDCDGDYCAEPEGWPCA
jgi:acyl-coenzyme A thioesterase PaaI-like protein